MTTLKSLMFLIPAILLSCREQSVVPIELENSNSASYIINGSEPSSQIQQSTVYLSGCTGVLIGVHTVLTAAHCIQKSESISVSANKAEVDSQKIAEVKFYPGSKQKGQIRYPDVALVRIARPITNKIPASLYEIPIRNQEVLSLVGFGRGTHNPHMTPDQVDVKVIASDFRTLAKIYQKESWAVKRIAMGFQSYSSVGALLALPSLNQSMCYGDSGGPAWRKTGNGYQVAGVNAAIIPHSQGAKGCPAPGLTEGPYVQIISPVYPVLSWIQATLQKWN